MGKGKKKQKGVVVVPHTRDMDDETFFKHLALRHAGEVQVPKQREAVEAWGSTYRAFHFRLHKIAVPGQYDHEHEGMFDE